MRFTVPYVLATAFVVGAIGHSPVLASDASDVTSRVQQLVEHFNKGDALTGDVADTLQIIDDHERLHSLVKADLREFTIVKTSPMPSYKGKLSDEELGDVLAYLLSLKGR